MLLQSTKDDFRAHEQLNAFAAKEHCVGVYQVSGSIDRCVFRLHLPQFSMFSQGGLMIRPSRPSMA